MSKLAGRMTYLAFGVLGGIAATVLSCKLYEGNLQLAEVLQISIATLVAFTGGMSAIAATKATAITEMSQKKEDNRRIERILTAKFAIEDARSVFDDETYPAHKPRTFAYIEGFDVPKRMIDLALMEPLNKKQYQAFMSAQATIVRMQRSHIENGDLDPAAREWATEQLTESLNQLQKSETS